MRNLLMKTGFILILFGIIGLMSAFGNIASERVGLASIISTVAGIFFLKFGNSVEDSRDFKDTPSRNYSSKLFLILAAIIKAISFCWLFIWTTVVILISISILKNSTNILEHFPFKPIPDIEGFLLGSSLFFIPPIVFLVIIWFIERAIYGSDKIPNVGNEKPDSILNYSTKWLASVLAGVVSGIVVWVITK
jgi:hypothetical protein